MYKNITDRFTNISNKIKQACTQSQRSDDEVKLIAVSKLQSIEVIKSAYEIGIKDFGENYGIMILCFTCKRMIPSYLFNNDPRKVNKKRSSCKKCMVEHNKQRRTHWTLEQVVQHMLRSARRRTSAKRRKNKKYVRSTFQRKIFYY